MTGQHTSPEAASGAAKQQSTIVSLVRRLDTGEILFSHAVSQEDGVTSTVASMPYLKGTTARSMKAVSQRNSVSKSISRQAFVGLGFFYFFSARSGWAVLAGVGLKARGGAAVHEGRLQETLAARDQEVGKAQPTAQAPIPSAFAAESSTACNDLLV